MTTDELLNLSLEDKTTNNVDQSPNPITYANIASKPAQVSECKSPDNYSAYQFLVYFSTHFNKIG